jgi:hypothetical protein
MECTRPVARHSRGAPLLLLGGRQPQRRPVLSIGISASPHLGGKAVTRSHNARRSPERPAGVVMCAFVGRRPARTDSVRPRWPRDPVLVAAGAPRPSPSSSDGPRSVCVRVSTHAGEESAPGICLPCASSDPAQTGIRRWGSFRPAASLDLVLVGGRPVSTAACRPLRKRRTRARTLHVDVDSVGACRCRQRRRGPRRAAGRPRPIRAHCPRLCTLAPIGPETPR